MNENTKKNESMDYNERADGYGFGPAESEHEELPYEKERESEESQEAQAPTKDENGLPNQHGEVDQYSFREH